MEEVEEAQPAPQVPAKRGQFVKGQSGNPHGRPKGSKSAITLLKTQLEGELRQRMKKDMHAVVAEVVRQALPRDIIMRDGNGNPIKNEDGTYKTETKDGDREMLKLLFSSWVPKARASEDDSPREKIQIVIGKLDQVPDISGRVVDSVPKR